MGQVIEGIGNAIGSVAEGIGDAVGGVVGGIGEAAGGFMQGVAGAAGQVMEMSPFGGAQGMLGAGSMDNLFGGPPQNSAHHQHRESTGVSGMLGLA